MLAKEMPEFLDQIKAGEFTLNRTFFVLRTLERSKIV